MMVHVLSIEYNRGSDSEGASVVHGVYASPTAARRASWKAIREQIEMGLRVYGRKHGSDWDADVKVESFEVEA